MCRAFLADLGVEWDIVILSGFRIVWDSVWDISSSAFSSVCAALAFYAVTAMIPVLVIVAAVLSFFRINMLAVMKSLDILLPDFAFSMAQLAEPVLGILTHQRPFFVLISCVFAYYLGARLFLEVRRAVQLALEVSLPKDTRLLLLAIPIYVGMALMIYFGGYVVLEVYRWVDRNLVMAVVPESLHFWVFHGTMLVSFVIVFVGTFFSYWIFSGARRTFSLKDVAVVSVVMAGVFLGLREGFGWYVRSAVQLNPVYGVFGGVFGFLYWAYLAFMLFLVGARVLFYLGNLDEGRSSVGIAHQN